MITTIPIVGVEFTSKPQLKNLLSNHFIFIGKYLISGEIDQKNKKKTTTTICTHADIDPHIEMVSNQNCLN